MFVIVETKSRGVKFKVSGWLGEQQLNFVPLLLLLSKKKCAQRETKRQRPTYRETDRDDQNTNIVRERQRERKRTLNTQAKRLKEKDRDGWNEKDR